MVEVHTNTDPLKMVYSVFHCSCIPPGYILGDIQLYPPWMCVRGIQLYPPWVCIRGYTVVSSPSQDSRYIRIVPNTYVHTQIRI